MQITETYSRDYSLPGAGERGKQRAIGGKYSGIKWRCDYATLKLY